MCKFSLHFHSATAVVEFSQSLWFGGWRAGRSNVINMQDKTLLFEGIVASLWGSCSVQSRTSTFAGIGENCRMGKEATMRAFFRALDQKDFLGLCSSLEFES